MPAILSVQKHHRVATFAARPMPATLVGRLEVHWGSAFDRACALVTAPKPSPRHRPVYARLLRDLRNETGCTTAELLAHGRKVRALLFFAQEQLTRSGDVAGLPATHKHAFHLPPVTPGF
jgi:hypothetical protein